MAVKKARHSSFCGDIGFRGEMQKPKIEMQKYRAKSKSFVFELSF
ncbi:MAG: hypothetical protein WBH01_06200 [Dehalococcoidia bacterium]|jgi:hypothetical protein